MLMSIILFFYTWCKCNRKFINVKISYYVSGAIRKLLNPRSRKEGEPLSKIAVFMQNATLPITKILDKVFTSQRNIGKLIFQRT